MKIPIGRQSVFFQFDSRQVLAMAYTWLPLHIALSKGVQSQIWIRRVFFFVPDLNVYSLFNPKPKHGK